jgi:hypothetical protein
VITFVKPYACTAQERRFLDGARAFVARGGTYGALIANLDAIDSTDRVAAYEQLLAEAVNPVDRQLFEAGLDVFRGGEA